MFEAVSELKDEPTDDLKTEEKQKEETYGRMVVRREWVRNRRV